VSDAQDPPQDPPRDDESAAGHHDPVGSVGEEAAKLLGALSDWARDQGTDYAGSAAGAASSFAHAVKDVAGAMGGFATEVFEIRDSARRAREQNQPE